MSTRASILIDRFQTLGTVCERLLHPSVTDGDERARQKRLLLVLFGAPFLGVAATVQILMQANAASGAITFVPLVFGLSLLLPLALIATARRPAVEAVALCVGTAAIGAVVALGGGVASPFAALAIALVIEPLWLARARKAGMLGLGAAAAALFAAPMLGAGVLPVTEPSAWSWLTPLLYGVAVLARFPVAEKAVENGAVARTSEGEAAMAATRAAILHLQSNGDVVQASAQSRTILGVEPEILHGTGFFERVLISDRIAYLSAMADLREGKPSAQLRLRIRVPAEAGASVGSVYRTFVAEMGLEQGGVVMVLRDDEATSQLEESLAEAKLEVEKTVQLRDQMLASVSHELRTPLSAIVGFSDVLTNEMFGPFANERQREYVTLINEASSHLLNVVNAVLDVSKIQSGTYVGDVEEFELAASAKLAVAMIAQEANAKSVNLELDLNEEIGLVCCDRRAVQQILINLLSNAVKFTPEGTVRLSAQKRGEKLFLTVTDTGIGIAPEDLSRLGKPFTQIRNEHASKGTGLGLALVNGLVQECGGSFRIESAPGAGTKVHVSIPVGETRVVRMERKSGAESSGECKEIPFRKTA